MGLCDLFNITQLLGVNIRAFQSRLGWNLSTYPKTSHGTQASLSPRRRVRLFKNNCTRPLEPSKCGPFPFMSSSLDELGKVLLKKMSWVIILRVHRGNRWLRTNDLDKHNLASSEVPQQGLQVTLWTQRGLGLIESCQPWGALSRPCINSETHGHRPTPHPSRCRS